jgi:hypothetical protein
MAPDLKYYAELHETLTCYLHSSLLLQDNMDIHVYRVGLPNSLQHVQGVPIKIDPNGNPLVLAMQLAQTIAGGQDGPSVVDVVFGAAAAKVALQTLAVARVNLNSAGAWFVVLDGMSAPAA